MMTKAVFTPVEQSVLVLAAYKVQSDKNIELYLGKLEKIFLNKLREASETFRLMNLPSSQSK